MHREHGSALEGITQKERGPFPSSYCNSVISQHRLAPETDKAELPRGAGAGAGNLFDERVGSSAAEASFLVCIWRVGPGLRCGVDTRNHHFGRFKRGPRGTRAVFCYRGTQAVSSQRWCDLVVRELSKLEQGSAL